MTASSATPSSQPLPSRQAAVSLILTAFALMTVGSQDIIISTIIHPDCGSLFETLTWKFDFWTSLKVPAVLLSLAVECAPL
jgi:hypothetical protein